MMQGVLSGAPVRRASDCREIRSLVLVGFVLCDGMGYRMGNGVGNGMGDYATSTNMSQSSSSSFVAVDFVIYTQLQLKSSPSDA